MSSANFGYGLRKPQSLERLQARLDTHEQNKDNPHEISSSHININLSDYALQTDLGSHESDTGNPHAVTKEQIGLSEINNIKDNLASATDPSSTDDSSSGYVAGSTWMNINNETQFVCTDASVGSANWRKLITRKDVWVIKDVKSNGIHGGTSVASWTRRDLNIIEKISGVGDEVTLVGNQITILPGKYLIIAEAPSRLVYSTKIRFQNITDGTSDIIGTADWVYYNISRSSLKGVIDISSTKIYELQQRCQYVQTTWGLGLANGFGSEEIYSIVTIKKLD